MYGGTDEATLINRSFKFFDLDGDGGVSMAEFGKTMEKLGVFIPTSHNLTELFNHYDANGNGVLDYQEFTNVFLGRAPARESRFAITEPTVKTRAYSPAKGTSTLGYAQFDSLANTLRACLKARGARGIIGLGRAFRIMDDDRSRGLGPEEFTKAMHDYGTGFTQDEVNALFTGFDTNRNGVVDYDEFLRFIRGPLNPFRQKLVDQAWNIIDRDGNGQLDINDIKGRYDASKHPDVVQGKKTEAEVLGEFLETFEDHHATLTGGSHDQVVTKDEWNEYYTNVSSSIDRDDYFELMMNNAWKMGEGAKTYATGWSNTTGAAAGQRANSSYGQFYQNSSTGAGIQRSTWLGYTPQTTDKPHYDQSALQ